MKSSFLIVSSIIAISVACSAYQSAGSQPLANTNNAQTPPAAQTNTPTPPEQEKTPCTLTLAGAPVINGVRLGMTADEVLALFPGSKGDAELQADLSRPAGRFGNASFMIRPSKYESKDQFAGINQIAFNLLDGRVSNFNIGYNGPEYPHVDKFVEKFLEGKSLPAVDQWEPYVGLDNSLKILKCAEFEVRVFAGGQGGNLNYVLLQDLVADKTLKDRRAKARAQATPTP